MRQRSQLGRLLAAGHLLRTQHSPPGWQGGCASRTEGVPHGGRCTSATCQTCQRGPPTQPWGIHNPSPSSYSPLTSRSLGPSGTLLAARLVVGGAACSVVAAACALQPLKRLVGCSCGCWHRVSARGVMVLVVNSPGGQLPGGRAAAARLAVGNSQLGRDEPKSNSQTAQRRHPDSTSRPFQNKGVERRHRDAQSHPGAWPSAHTRHGCPHDMTG